MSREVRGVVPEDVSQVVRVVVRLVVRSEVSAVVGFVVPRTVSADATGGAVPGPPTGRENCVSGCPPTLHMVSSAGTGFCAVLASSRALVSGGGHSIPRSLYLSGADGDCPAALVPTVPWARQTQLLGTHPRHVPRVAPWTCPLLWTVPEALEQDPGHDAQNSVPGNVRDDEANCEQDYVPDNLQDCRSGSSARDPGRYLPRSSPDALRDHGRRTPGRDGRDNPVSDVQDCRPDEGPGNGPDSFVDNSVGNPPGAGVDLTLDA